jgi:hypothetical protein
MHKRQVQFRSLLTRQLECLSCSNTSTFIHAMGAAIDDGVLPCGYPPQARWFIEQHVYIKRVRSEVTPGTSALFVLTSAAALDRVQEAFKDIPMTLITTNLSQEQEGRLREAFSEE